MLSYHCHLSHDFRYYWIIFFDISWNTLNYWSTFDGLYFWARVHNLPCGFFCEDELISHRVPEFVPNQVVLSLQILFNLHLDTLYFSPWSKSTIYVALLLQAFPHSFYTIGGSTVRVRKIIYMQSVMAGKLQLEDTWYIGLLMYVTVAG